MKVSFNLVRLYEPEMIFDPGSKGETFLTDEPGTCR